MARHMRPQLIYFDHPQKSATRFAFYLQFFLLQGYTRAEIMLEMDVYRWLVQLAKMMLRMNVAPWFQGIV